MSSYAASLTSQITTALGSPASSPAPTPAATAPVTPVTTEAPASTPAVTESPVIITPSTTSEPVAPAPITETPDFATEEFQFSDELTEIKPEATQAQTDLTANKDEQQNWAGMLPKEVESAFLRTARGRRMLDSFKANQEFEKLPSEGGLGFIPTIEQTKQAFNLYNDLRDMTAEFHSGDPTKAQNWVQNWFLPAEGQPLSQGSREVAKSFLPTLAQRANAGDQSARELYVSAAMPAVMTYVEELYSKASGSTDPEMRMLWFNVARMCESDLTGKFRPIAKDVLEGTAQVPAQVDPQNQQLDARVQEIRRFESQQQTRNRQQFDWGVSEAIKTNLMGDITQALAPLKEAYEGDVYDTLVEKFHNKVVDMVRKSPENLRAFNEAKELAAQSPNKQNIEAAGKAWAAVARPVVRSMRAAYLSSALKGKTLESASRHAVLTEASQKRGAASVAQPTQKDLTVGPKERQPGESYPEYLHRITKAVMVS